MYQGTVQWFCPEQGFGVITNDENRSNLFVHYSGIQSDGFPSLIEGQKVMYDVAYDQINSSKSLAINVYTI